MRAFRSVANSLIVTSHGRSVMSCSTSRGYIVVLEEHAATLDDWTCLAVTEVLDEDVVRLGGDIGREMEGAAGLENAPHLRERDGILADADVLDDGHADAIVEGLVGKRERGCILDIELEVGVDRPPRGDLGFEQVDADPAPSSFGLK